MVWEDRGETVFITSLDVLEQLKRDDFSVIPIRFSQGKRFTGEIGGALIFEQFVCPLRQGGASTCASARAFRHVPACCR